MRLLYLHGFRSSPAIDKAQTVAQYCVEHKLPPPIILQLPISPLESIQLCEQLIAEQKTSAVCGSSLGGFYALYLAEKYGLRCGLINPAITPWGDLEREDNQRQYRIEELDQSSNSHYIDQLKAYFTPKLTHPKNVMVLIGTEDEVLNPQQMIAHLAKTQQIIVAGADHSMSDFGGYLPKLMQFLQRH